MNETITFETPAIDQCTFETKYQEAPCNRPSVVVICHWRGVRAIDYRTNLSYADEQSFRADKCFAELTKAAAYKSLVAVLRGLGAEAN